MIRPIQFTSSNQNLSDLKLIKSLIWIYFILLVFEGALRKWVLPFFSDPLLIIRDPVVLLIYVQAARANLFPRSKWIIVILIMAVFFLVWGVFQANAGGTGWRGYVVSVYGVRTFFLHLPLIFVMGSILNQEDVMKIGRWILIISIPMTLLMVAQYYAPSESIINKATTGADSKQLMAALDRVRPPGTFSFITGPMIYYPLVSSFCLFGMFQKHRFNYLLLFSALTTLILVIPLSGSRGLFFGILLVMAFSTFIAIKQPKLIIQLFAFGLVSAALGFCLLKSPMGKEAMESFSERYTSAMDSEGEGKGATVAMQRRVGGGLTEVFTSLDQIPFHGLGIGIGTNVGAMLTTGGVDFLAGESEWTRIVTESGVILGFSYIILRVFLAVWLLWRAWNSLNRGNILPWLLMGVAFNQLIQGQTAVPMLLGLMVFSAGLVMASMNTSKLMTSSDLRRPRLNRPM